MEVKGIYLETPKGKYTPDTNGNWIMYGINSDGTPIAIRFFTEEVKQDGTVRTETIAKIKVSDFSTNKKGIFHPFIYVPKNKKVINEHPIGTFVLELGFIPTVSLAAISLRPYEQRILAYTFRDNDGNCISEWIDLSAFEPCVKDLEIDDYNDDPPRENLVAKFSKKIKKNV